MSSSDSDLQILDSMFRKEQYAQVVKAAEQMIFDHGEEIGYLNFLGSALHNLRRYAESEPVLARSLAQAPEQPDMLVNQAQNKELLGKLPEALALFREAARLTTGDHYLSFKIGAVLNRLGQPAEAIKFLNDALRVRPGFVPAHLEMGRSYRREHRVAESIACCRRALQILPGSVQGWTDLAEMKRFVPGDPDIAAMRELLERPGDAVPRPLRPLLRAALGKAHEDIGDWGAAADLHLAALADRRAMSPYATGRLRLMLERVREVFDADTVAAGRAQGVRGVSPVFLVGMPRSGKTAVAEILARHPRVDVRRGGMDRVVEGLIPSAETFDPQGVRDALLAGGPVAPEMSDTVAVDDSPGNLWALGMVAMMFPEARVLWCRRDPLPSAVAMMTSALFQGRHRYRENAADTVEVMGLYDAMMAHWGAVSGLEIIEARLDRIADGGAAAQAELMVACGLDPADAEPAPEVRLGGALDDGLFLRQPDSGASPGPEMVAAFVARAPELRALT